MNTTEELLEFSRKEGIGADLLKLTTTLNKTSMDETSRALLGTPGVYEFILLKLLRREKAVAKDVAGMVQAVLVAVHDEPRTKFYDELLTNFLGANRLAIDAHLYRRLLAELIKRGVPLGAGRTGPAMRTMFDEVRAEGNLRYYVDKYVRRSGIERARFTQPVRQAMVDYLEGIGLVTDAKFDANFDNGDYDEYFAQAYHQAVVGRDGVVRTQHIVLQPAGDEFKLPNYEFGDEQGVVPSSIHVAAVAYQLFMIGDKLGMFQMPNALLARRARGKLDLPSGGASTLLQEYKRFQRAEDVQPEERMLLYKRIFNLGGGEVLEDTVVNEQFNGLWDSLMKEVGDYITKDEMSDALEDRVSRSRIHEGIRNLQVNLSFYAADIDEDVRLMMKQYKLAESILRNPEVMASVGLVRRKTLQAAIERLVADDAGSVPLVKALFTLGTRGQEILHFIADFDESTPDEEFRRFLSAAESWIISRSSLKDVDFGVGEEPEDTTDDDEDAGSQANGEDDWEN